MKNNGDLDLYSHCGFARQYQHGYSITVGKFPKPTQHPNFTEAEALNARGIAYSEKGEHDKAIATFSQGNRPQTRLCQCPFTIWGSLT